MGNAAVNSETQPNQAVRLFLCALALIFVAGCADLTNLPVFNQGEQWHRGEFSQFVFSLPPDFGKFELGNMGPAMAQYTNQDMIITLDGGATAGDRLGHGSGPDAAALAIPGYDSLSASQVVQRLAGLSRPELAAVGEYETAHRARRTVLTRISQLQGS